MKEGACKVLSCCLGAARCSQGTRPHKGRQPASSGLRPDNASKHRKSAACAVVLPVGDAVQCIFSDWQPRPDNSKLGQGDIRQSMLPSPAEPASLSRHALVHTCSCAVLLHLCTCMCLSGVHSPHCSPPRQDPHFVHGRQGSRLFDSDVFDEDTVSHGPSPAPRPAKTWNERWGAATLGAHHCRMCP